MDSQTARTRLETLLQELDATSQVVSGEHGGESSELSHVDQHPADTAGELTEIDQSTAMLEHVAEQRAQVVAALGRVDDGTYGTCVTCGEPISEERLDARPEAARCITCQSAHEDAAA